MVPHVCRSEPSARKHGANRTIQLRAGNFELREAQCGQNQWNEINSPLVDKRGVGKSGCLPLSDARHRVSTEENEIVLRLKTRDYNTTEE